MELIDIVDATGRPTGQLIEKGKAHTYGMLHRGAHIWIHDGVGRILLQQRAHIKSQNPGLWDIIAGHSIAGENPITTALRELHEELGVAVESLSARPPRRMSYRSRSRHCDVIIFPYILQLSIPITSYILQQEEVDAISYVDLDDLEHDLQDSNPKRRYAQEPAYWREIISTLRAI